MILLSLLLLVIGFLMLRFPEKIYDLTEGWKSNTPGEPSKWYRISLRVGGIAFLLVGVMGLVSLFIDRKSVGRERVCIQV